MLKYSTAKASEPQKVELAEAMTPTSVVRVASATFVDTLGLVLAVLVTGANVQDRDAAKELLASFYGAFFQSFGLKRVWADAGYQGALIPWMQAAFAWAPDILRRKEQQTGFEILPKRWLSNGPSPGLSATVVLREILNDFLKHPGRSSRHDPPYG